MAILGLLMAALMPLAQASGGSTGTLLAAICSPNGVRFVEVALGPAESEAPQPPDLGTLEHCPGCLGAGALAILPAAAVLPQLAKGTLVLPVPANHSANGSAQPGFQPRAPPTTS